MKSIFMAREQVKASGHLVTHGVLLPGLRQLLRDLRDLFLRKRAFLEIRHFTREQGLFGSSERNGYLRSYLPLDALSV